MWRHGWLAALAVTMWPVAPAGAAELIMFHRAGCPYCAAWEREIGPIYGKTEMSRRAPLRRVDLDRETAGVALRGRVIYTPTFVLADGNREVGRIEGYPGQEFFWALLEQLLDRIPERRSEAGPETGPALAAGSLVAAATGRKIEP